MIKFEHTEVVGWEHAIRGMRNPLNSWDKSDSFYGCKNQHGTVFRCDDGVCFLEDPCSERTLIVGENDLDLMKRLKAAGPEHRKYLRMIVAYVDITAPLYWWKEFDTYKVGTVANSCSTMHKIAAKEFTLDDFSHEHLMDEDDNMLCSTYDVMCAVVMRLNACRKLYVQTKDKKYWWQMIQLLPSSYNQKRTIELNYETLSAIYKQRKNHKLDEWSKGFMSWIESLPYARELIMGDEE